jgi:hypothetical protein
MQIVFYNKKDKPVHECNVCHNVGVWSKKWVALGFGVGVGYRGEDRVFITCSNECRRKNKEDKIFQKFRNQLADEWYKNYSWSIDNSEKKLLKDIYK